MLSLVLLFCLGMGTASVLAAPEEKASASKITKIVFVGKQKACDCTRKRVDDSFAALQSALAGRSDITIERLQADSDADRVAPYKEMRAMMVLPAIYLLDSAGALVEMLQGEVTSEQFQKALK